jgi:hypothetical protein
VLSRVTHYYKIEDLMMKADMEWIFILIGIAYSIYSSIKKDAKAREAKMREGGPRPRLKIDPRNPADAMFVKESGRRTIGGAKRDINTVAEARAYGRDVTAVEELSLEDVQEDFTTRLNRKLMERGAQPGLRRSISEVFSDLTESENKRAVDYDDLPSYDDRSNKYVGTEHDARSHFKLNEGLRKDSFQVGKSSVFDDLDNEEEAARRSGRKRIIQLDPASLKRYIVMHEVLGKPRATQSLQASRRR